MTPREHPRGEPARAQRACCSLDVIRFASARQASEQMRAVQQFASGDGRAFAALRTAAGDQIRAPWPADVSGASVARRRDGWGIAADPCRVLVLGAWANEDARRRFRRDAIFRCLDEHWRLDLWAIRSFGCVDGRDPVESSAETCHPDRRRPAVILTWLNAPLDFAVALGHHMQSAADDLHRRPGALAAFRADDITGEAFRGFTVSCWRRLEDGLAFAYRAQPHRSAMQWYRRRESTAELTIESWSARLSVERSTGSLAGADPFGTLIVSPETS
jgi:hypothetical protein